MSTLEIFERHFSPFDILFRNQFNSDSTFQPVGNFKHPHPLNIFYSNQVNISDESYSDIIEPNKAKQDSYSFANIRAGISNEAWVAEIYIDNVTDERAEISNNFVYDRFRVAYIRPRTMGFKYKYNF